MQYKKLQCIKESDLEQILKIARGLLDINTKSLTKNQKKMLRDQYLANLRRGFEPREAMEKAFDIVKCFNHHKY